MHADCVLYFACHLQRPTPALPLLRTARGPMALSSAVFYAAGCLSAPPLHAALFAGCRPPVLLRAARTTHIAFIFLAREVPAVPLLCAAQPLIWRCRTPPSGALRPYFGACHV